MLPIQALQKRRSNVGKSLFGRVVDKVHTPGNAAFESCVGRLEELFLAGTHVTEDVDGFLGSRWLESISKETETTKDRCELTPSSTGVEK